MMLPTIGGMSRNRAHSTPSSRHAAMASASHSAMPPSAPSAAQPGQVPYQANTPTMTMMLCASTSTLRTTARATYTVNGSRTERMLPSAEVKHTQASVTMPLNAFHSTSDNARYGM